MSAPRTSSLAQATIRLERATQTSPAHNLSPAWLLSSTPHSQPHTPGCACSAATASSTPAPPWMLRSATAPAGGTLMLAEAFPTAAALASRTSPTSRSSFRYVGKGCWEAADFPLMDLVGLKRASSRPGATSDESAAVVALAAAAAAWPAYREYGVRLRLGSYDTGLQKVARCGRTEVLSLLRRRACAGCLVRLAC